MKVILIYFVGFIISLGAGILLGNNLGLSGYLLGFILGQILIILLLMERLKREFPMGEENNFEFMRYFGKYPQLAIAAFLYNFGFWIDKIFMWYSPKGSEIAGAFRYYYPYDSSTFLAIFTIIPAMATFFLDSETDFYEVLRKYVYSILYKGNYQEIDNQKKNLEVLVKTKIFGLIKVQFVVTLIAFLLAPDILSFMGYNPKELVVIFRICLLASFFQVILLIMTVLFWYLELLDDSFYSVLLFAFLNFSINYYLMFFTSATPGIGWLISAFISVVFAVGILMVRIKDLNYVVFANNPILESQKMMPKFE
jgi:uncharacterized membrane protein